MARNSSHLRAGIIVGGLLALGASVAGREIMRRAGTRMIDTFYSDRSRRVPRPAD